MWKILNQILHFGKQGIKKILKYNRYTRKVDTIKIQEKIKITYQKARYQRNTEKQLESKKEVPQKSYMITNRI